MQNQAVFADASFFFLLCSSLHAEEPNIDPTIQYRGPQSKESWGSALLHVFVLTSVEEMCFES